MRVFSSRLLADYGEEMEHTDWSEPVSMASLTGISNVVFYDIAIGNMGYVLVGASGKILTTNNFSTFTTKNLSTGDRIYRVSVSGNDVYGLGITSSTTSGNLEEFFLISVSSTTKAKISNTTNKFAGQDIISQGGGLVVGKKTTNDKGMIIHRSNTGSNNSPVFTSFELETKRLVRIERVNNKTIAIGDEGYVVEITRAVSTDANISYTISQIKSDFDCYGIAYGNGKYVVVSSDGYYSTSTDLYNWSDPKQLHEDISQPYIVFAYNKFIVIDYSGRTISSYDGENWQNFKTIEGASQNIFANAIYAGWVVSVGSKYSTKEWKPKGV